MQVPTVFSNRSLYGLIIFGVLALFSQSSHAQTLTTARGVVADALTQEPLAFATVQFEGTNMGATTDVDGRFSIEIKAAAARLKVTYVGYQPLFVNLQPGKSNNNLTIGLHESSNTLKEVVVRNEKYRNKGNPAVELIRQVIDHKEQNRPEGLDFFSYEQYEKVEVALNNVDDKMRNKRLFRKAQFLFDNADTSATGQVSLSFYLLERLSDVYYRKSPRSEKTFVKGERSTGVPGGFFLDEQGIASYIQHMYQHVDIYDNRINLATVDFISPLAPMSPNVYRFYIQDTVQISGTRAVRLYFAPRTKGDLAFEGNMWVALDGSYAVRRIELGVPKGINLNWVSNMALEQQFDWVQNENEGVGNSRRLMLSQDVTFMQFGSDSQDTTRRGLVGRKTTTYRNYTLNEPLSDRLFKFGGNTRYEDQAMEKTEQFWAANRHTALTDREVRIQKTIDTLNNHKPFKRVMGIARILFEGYQPVGMVDVGPVNTFYSFNPVEGFRGRLGGRTNLKFSRDLQLEGFLAYGTKDERYKGYFGVTYSFSRGPVRRFPLDQVKLWFQDDVKIPGQELQFIAEDNFLLSFKRGVNDKMTYNRVLGAEYLKETQSGLAYSFSAKTERIQPAGALLFQYGAPEQPQFASEIRNADFGVHFRYAPNEKFYQGATYRTPILNKYPKIDLWYNLGARGVLGSQYNYHSVQMKVEKVMYISPLGWTHMVLEGGRVFGKVPFPLLKVHRANQTFAYQLESYNLMNFLEFVSDKYASVSATHNFGGFFFNRVPLLRRLKWREMVSFKGLWGGLDESNRPSAENGLYQFPTDANGVPVTYALGKKPYMEASIGVANIFKLLRIDYVRRLSYLDQPNVAKWGIRARVKVEF